MFWRWLSWLVWNLRLYLKCAVKVPSKEKARSAFAGAFYASLINQDRVIGLIWWRRAFVTKWEQSWRRAMFSVITQQQCTSRVWWIGGDELKQHIQSLLGNYASSSPENHNPDGNDSSSSFNDNVSRFSSNDLSDNSDHDEKMPPSKMATLESI